MKKVIFEYINKENKEICVLVNEEQDTLYKINMNDATLSFVQNIWSVDEILEEVRDELFVANDYINDLHDYIVSQNIDLKIKIYNEDGNELKSIHHAIKNRENTHYGIYHDIGVVLDSFSTFELFKYYISITGETSIRSYLEEGIIADTIHNERKEGK